MIIGLPVPVNSVFESVMAAMRRAQDKFYLTGSRKFLHHTKDSDWDFFTEYRSYGDQQKDFINMGFVQDKKTYTDDQFCVNVWKHEAANIHIQVVSSALEKDIAQEFLLASNLYHSKDKVLMSGCWAKAYGFARTAITIVNQANLE